MQETIKALKKHFGFTKFRVGQEEAISTILKHHDTLIVMPTGGGKSLCYQLPAMMYEGITLVVSPLIALMKDQVDALTAKGLPATFINSSLSDTEIYRRMDAMALGQYKLMYVAPERFKSQIFLESLRKIKVDLVAIDEAHCISQWGHDFRPDYLRLGKILPSLNIPQIIALTATATPDVRADIITQLGLGQNGRPEPVIYVSGFARPNLSFMVSQVSGNEDKYARIITAAKELGSGIVYCSTRKNVELVTKMLQSSDVDAIAYHAGLDTKERIRVQDAFMNKEVPIVVATNAFGMGVDRDDLRFVIHFNIPGNVEAYYQEAGRAGRDNEPAWCELLYNYADVRTQQFFIDGANPERPLIENVYRTLINLCLEAPIQMSISKISECVSSSNNGMAIGSALYLLEQAGAIQREYAPGSRVYTTSIVEPVKLFSALEIDYEKLWIKRQRDSEKLQQVIRYANHAKCRQQFILDYFGDQNDHQRCGKCDFCLAGQIVNRRKTSAEELTILRKTLSGIARANGQFGRGKIALMLKGSKTKEVINSNLNFLSTYGLLSEFPVTYIRKLIDALIDADCIAVNQGEYPTLSMTARGRDLLLNNIEIEVCFPELKSTKSKTAKQKNQELEALKPIDHELEQALRTWRIAKAEELYTPAYMILSNKVLEELAREHPKTQLELLKVKGIGPEKARQFGSDILALIKLRD